MCALIAVFVVVVVVVSSFDPGLQSPLQSEKLKNQCPNVFHWITAGQVSDLGTTSQCCILSAHCPPVNPPDAVNSPSGEAHHPMRRTQSKLLITAHANKLGTVHIGDPVTLVRVLVLKRPGGLLLALPGNAIASEVLAAGFAEEDAADSPWALVVCWRSLWRALVARRGRPQAWRHCRCRGPKATLAHAMPLDCVGRHVRRR